MWIEGSWAPKLQQVNEEPIMEIIVRLKGMTKCDLKHVNTVRLWMRAVTVADMANESGIDIMDNAVSTILCHSTNTHYGPYEDRVPVTGYTHLDRPSRDLRWIASYLSSNWHV